MFDQLRRRSYLGGLVGGLVAAAGCNALKRNGDENEGSDPGTAGERSTGDAPSTTDGTQEAAATDDGEDGTDDGPSSESGRIRYAPPGAVQSTVDGVADDGGGVVRLQAGTPYDEGTEIHVEPGVTLDFNGAVLEVSGGHDGLFLDTASNVVDARIDVTARGYDGSAVTLDVTRSTHGKYNGSGDRDTSASFEGAILGNVDAVGGSGIELVSDGAAFESVHDSGITIGCHLEATVAHFERGVRAVVRNGGWINSVRFDLDLSGNEVGFLHTGEGDGLLLSDIYGPIQTSWHEGSTGIRNETDQPSLTFHGRIWDADPDRDQRAVEGTGITVVSDLAATHTETALEAAGSYGIDTGGDGVRFVDYGGGGTFLIRPSDVGVTLESEGGARLFLGDDGQVRPQPGGSYVQILGEDLQQRSGANWWELAVDDGTNTESGDPALAMWYGGEWLLFESTDSVVP